MQLRSAETKISLKAVEDWVPVPDEVPIPVDGHRLAALFPVYEESFFFELDCMVALFLDHPTHVSPGEGSSRKTPGFADALHETTMVIRTAPHRS